jgi:hypothetical protein
MSEQKNWKPQSYSSVSPYLVVSGAQSRVRCDGAEAIWTQL